MSERNILITVSLCATILFGLLALVVTYGYSASFDTATLLAIRDSQSAALALVLLFIFWKSRFRAWIVTLAIAYVLLIGVSRLYLGVHFPTDIIGGWLLAVVWVSIVAAITLRLRTAKTTKGSTAV